MLARAARVGCAAAVLVAAIAVLPGRAAPVAAVLQLPAGFSPAPIPTGQAAGDLTGFALVPAGDPGAGGAYTIGKCGTVAWVSGDGHTVHTIAHLPVYSRQDIGLIGINLTRH